jgi:hypothetical protein
VVIDFRESKIADMSAIDAVHKLTERYAKEGKRFICHLVPIVVDRFTMLMML